MNTQTWNASTHASRHVYVSHVAAGKARQQNSKEPEATELNPHADRPQSATETVFYENDIVLKDLQDETIYIFDVIGVVSTGTDEQHVLAETEGGATRKKGSRAWNRTVKWKPQRNNIAPELQLILWNNYFRAGPVYNLPRQDYAICPVSPEDQRTRLACTPVPGDENKHAGHIISDYYRGPTITQNLIPEGARVNSSHGELNLIDYMVGARMPVEPTAIVG